MLCVTMYVGVLIHVQVCGLMARSETVLVRHWPQWFMDAWPRGKKETCLGVLPSFLGVSRGSLSS